MIKVLINSITGMVEQACSCCQPGGTNSFITCLANINTTTFVFFSARLCPAIGPLSVNEQYNIIISNNKINGSPACACVWWSCQQSQSTGPPPVSSVLECSPHSSQSANTVKIVQLMDTKHIPITKA
jgi:hypothetical protein